MRVDLRAIPSDPGGHARARSGERAEIDDWMATHWPDWRQEVSRAADKGDEVAVTWVGPVVPYAVVGGVVAETYFVYRRELT